MEDGRVLHQPMAQVASHQPMARQQQEQDYRAASAHLSPRTAYAAPQVAAAPYAQAVEQRPESPSPPPSSQHSPQTPYTPFHQPVAVYAPVPAQYPPHGGDQQQQQQYLGEAHGAYDTHTSQQQHAYAPAYPAAPHQQQPTPYAAYEAYDSEGRVLNFNYGAVLPVMQYQQQETYDKQQPAMVYMDEQRSYSPAVLPPQLPALRRESVGGSTYVAGAESQTTVASSSLAGAGYIRRESAPQYIPHSPTPSPQVRRDSYPLYAPSPTPAPYLHHPQPQPPTSGEYLAHYGWPVAEVQ
ncbi:hypothetical protein C8F04DRAFT_1111221 [Mycena alexandri]|uniref:Uncharacterized protein n=1 Tax=Mycena alexandri TaxID=1745969 RepID=A0AAD6SPG4_9AGAR|nr:hypothetical protein C8F04DRAFT_1111221 [Mycena alexandri]